MKLDPKIAALFAAPFLALSACVIMAFALPEPKPFALSRPEFLGYIDQLGISSENDGRAAFSGSIRNVFSGEESAEEEPLENTADIIAQPAARPPVSVSMLVESGAKSFGIVNGKKMRVGESSGSFTLTAIRKNSVTVRYLDGIEETINVKAY